MERAEKKKEIMEIATLITRLQEKDRSYVEGYIKAKEDDRLEMEKQTKHIA